MSKKNKNDLSEPRTRSLLEKEFGCYLDRVCEGKHETADFRSRDDLRSIEVKQITTQYYYELTKAASKMNRSYDSTVLSGRWRVMIKLFTNATALEPMPEFPVATPEVSSEVRRNFGVGIVSRHERESGWRATHPGPKMQKGPQLNRLATDLENLLLELEKHDVHSTRGNWPATRDGVAALMEIARKTNRALCIRHDTIADEKPGIDFSFTAGYECTGNPNTLVERIELWLASDEHSLNLRKSLRNELNMERHAVLVFDSATEPEYDSAVKGRTSFVPTKELILPEEIDVLWFILGPVACRYTAGDGWSARLMPDMPSSKLEA